MITLKQIYNKLVFNLLNLLLVVFIFANNRLSGQCWSFSLANASVINQSMFPAENAGYFPDGNINVISIGGDSYAFWANFNNFRTINASPLLQNHENQLNPTTPVFGGRQPDNGASNGFNDGGMWLIGVRQLTDGRLVGFFHAESHWYPRTTQGWFAYKSIGVAYSSDNGATWGTPELILKHANNKPVSPQWSGLGDGCVIYNHLNNKYYCYYTPATGTTSICMAASADPNGYVGSWNKWYNGSFTQSGIGGLETPVAGLSNNPGANPSVHWNTYLNKFIMVWHGWDEKLYISASDDGEVWEDPQVLLDEGNKTWYPVIVGTTSANGGQTVTLYYANNFQPDGKRTMSYRTLTFSQGPVSGATQHLNNGRYSVRNTSNNKNLAATGASSFNGVLVFPDIYTDQRWDLTHLGNNEYHITHACCGGRLDVQASACANASQVLSATANGSSNSQIWIIDKLPDNTFVLRPKHCLTQALGRASSSSDNVVTLDYDSCSGLQNWSFIAETLSSNYIDNKHSYTLYPNPAKESITLKGFTTNGLAKIKVTDIKGTTIESIEKIVDSDSIDINVSQYRSGIYFIRILQDNTKHVFKFIK